MLHRVPRRAGLRLGLLAAAQVAALLLWWQLGWACGLAALLLVHGAVLWGTFAPTSQLLAPALVRLPDARGQVWLTIDDGPSDDTLPILDLLDRAGAKATFFLVGERAARRPQLVREIVRRGHGIGNHSASHPAAAFWRLGPARMAREIGEGQRLLASASGRAPVWFRSVVGHTNPFVAPALQRHGLARVAWSARGYDGAARCNPDAVLRRIERGLRPGAIVLLHEGEPHGHNVQIVGRVLARLGELGYAAVLPEDAFTPATPPPASC
ncbi:MAG: polysaccharide deacetylase family protein [Pseudoxanthomonas sp.]